MWPYPIREPEAYTYLAVRHTVHDRLGGGHSAFWSRREAQAWKEEEDQAWIALNRIAGDSLTREGGALLSLVWAAAWHVTNHKYHCDGASHDDYAKFTTQAVALATALAAPDLSHNIQWFVWNCAWVAVHNYKHDYTQSHWNAGHDVGRGFGIAAVVSGVIAAPFTFGLSLAGTAAGSAGLSAQPPRDRQTVRGRDTDYQGDLMRMVEHKMNLEARQAGLADVYRGANIEEVRRLRVIVYRKVHSLSLSRKILRFLWAS